MLRRLSLSCVFALMFALVQMGVLTHEISHIHTATQQQQSPDKHSTTEQCAQCLAFAQVAAGSAPASIFVTQLHQAEFQLATAYVAHLRSVLIAPYSARGPPHTSII